MYLTRYILSSFHERIYSSGYEPADRSAVKMNPVTSHRQGGDVKSSECTLEWMVKSHKDISNTGGNMGLFVIVF